MRKTGIKAKPLADTLSFSKGDKVRYTDPTHDAAMTGVVSEVETGSEAGDYVKTDWVRVRWDNTGKTETIHFTSPKIDHLELVAKQVVKAEEEEDLEEEAMGPEEGDYILTPGGQLGGQTHVSQVGGKFLGAFSEDEEAEAFIKNHMEKNKFWPNVWYVSDHGNVSPYTLTATINVKAGFGPGDLVMMREVLEPGDESMVYRVIEDRDTRVLVEAQNGMAIPPQMVFLKKDLKPSGEVKAGLGDVFQAIKDGVSAVLGLVRHDPEGYRIGLYNGEELVKELTLDEFEAMYYDLYNAGGRRWFEKVSDTVALASTDDLMATFNGMQEVAGKPERVKFTKLPDTMPEEEQAEKFKGPKPDVAGKHTLKASGEDHSSHPLYDKLVALSTAVLAGIIIKVEGDADGVLSDPSGQGEDMDYYELWSVPAEDLVNNILSQERMYMSELNRLFPDAASKEPVAPQSGMSASMTKVVKAFIAKKGITAELSSQDKAAVNKAFTRPGGVSDEEWFDRLYNIHFLIEDIDMDLPKRADAYIDEKTASAIHAFTPEQAMNIYSQRGYDKLREGSKNPIIDEMIAHMVDTYRSDKPLKLTSAEADGLEQDQVDPEVYNTPCKKCGDTQTPLHTNGLCGNCWAPGAKLISAELRDCPACGEGGMEAETMEVPTGKWICRDCGTTDVDV